MCIEAGLDIKSIRRRLGHSSARIADDRYSHLLEPVEDRSIAALETLATV